MKLKDEDGWNQAIEANKESSYGMGVIRFAIKWADLMEERIADGETVFDCAEAMADKADTEGITGFMYGCAVRILVQVWQYGEDLRKWHNDKYAYKGNGVVNSAVITV